MMASSDGIVFQGGSAHSAPMMSFHNHCEILIWIYTVFKNGIYKILKKGALILRNRVYNLYIFLNINRQRRAQARTLRQGEV